MNYNFHLFNLFYQSLLYGYTRHVKNAVNIYNQSLKKTAQHNLNFQLGLNCNSFGVKMTF